MDMDQNIETFQTVHYQMHMDMDMDQNIEPYQTVHCQMHKDKKLLYHHYCLHQSHLESHLQSSTVAGLMLFVMLDLHSLFAGMSVGVKLNDLSLLFALGIHKLTAAFALGS